MSTKPSLPIFALEYSPPKYGKTENAIRAFPNAEFIGDPKAIIPLFQSLEIPLPTIHDVNTLEQADKKVEEIAKRKKSCVLDDLTVLGDDTVLALTPKFGDNKLKLYDAFRIQMVTLRNRARDAGIHVWATAHIMPPDPENGRMGGPKLPGQNSYAISAVVETIGRVEPSPQIITGWPMAYKVDPKDKAYVTGDRWGVLYDGAPHNAGELMRARGFDLPRAVGLEWQEDVVEAIAQEFLALAPNQLGPAKKVIFQKWFSDLEQNGIIPPHIYWTLRDGFDRSTIRRYNSRRHATMLGL